MAKVWLGYPVATVKGNFATGVYRKGSSVLGPRKPYPPSRKKGHTCPCKCWLWADWSWTHGLVDQEAWRVALKRPHMSRYDLWMREAVWLASKGHYMPDYPSISGGYSTKNAISGHHLQPPYQCIPPFAQLATYELRYPGPSWDDYYGQLPAMDPRPAQIGIEHVSIASFPDGEGEPPGDQYEADGSYVDGWFSIPAGKKALFRATARSLDGLIHSHWYGNDCDPPPDVRASVPSGSWKREAPWE
jgi:hypothetical protein